MKATSHEIAPGLYLVRAVIGAALAKSVEQPTNHLVVIDCSGSMGGDLPKLREQLKKKLPKLLKDGDTISIVWFSSRGEFGTLIEGETVATLRDLDTVNKAIDRWLKPVGLTGFKEPLEEVAKLAKKLAKNGNAASLFFMSDGCDNQWNRGEILKAVEKAAGVLASATFVEYGFYADRPLLAAMAEKAGGQLIFAEHFDKYEPVFEAALAKRAIGGKRIEVKIEGDPIGGFAFYGENGDIFTFDASAGKVTLPETASELCYLSPTLIGDRGVALERVQHDTGTSGILPVALQEAYIALSLFAVRMKSEIVFPLLKALGDVTFIENYAACFGKQAYSTFMEQAKVAAFEPSLRYTKGYNPNLVPPDDAFTVLDLLRTLADDESATLLLDHPEWKYNAISRGRVDGSENLSAAETKQVEAIRTKMAGEKNAKKLKALQDEIDVILATKTDALKFEPEPAPDGYPIVSLVFNEDRPNISVRVLKKGMVDVNARLGAAAIANPKADLTKVPSKFATNTWRTYTIVADGIVNVEKLVVKASKETLKKLVKSGVEMWTAVREERLPITRTRWSSEWVRTTDMVDVLEGPVTIRLKELPILNRKMVKGTSAKELMTLSYALLQHQADAKVYKHVFNEKFPDAKLLGYTALYGADGAAWLKEQGITEGGFSPKMVVDNVRDFYMGKELLVKIKGHSSLPSMNELAKRVAEGKTLNGPATMMKTALDEIEAFLAKAPKPSHKAWLEGKMKTAVAETRSHLYQIAQIKMAVIIGQVWFSDLASPDVTTLTLSNGVTASFELNEVKVEI